MRLRAALEAATRQGIYLVPCALRKRAGVQRAWGSQVLCRWRMVDLGPPVMLQPHPGFGCGQPAQRNGVGVQPMPSGFKRWWQREWAGKPFAISALTMGSTAEVQCGCKAGLDVLRHLLDSILNLT